MNLKGNPGPTPIGDTLNQSLCDNEPKRKDKTKGMRE